MSNLTANRSTPSRKADLRVFTAASTIYAGALVALNASGKLVPAGDVAGLTVVGRAEENASSGEKCRVANGCFRYDGTGYTAADVGSVAYAADDQTVAKSGTNNIVAGTVFDVDDDGVWIIVPAAATVEVAVTQAAASGNE